MPLRQAEPLRVLVADPDSDELALYRSALTTNGVDVIEAADGREALVHALIRRPHVAVLEARLPYIDGLALCGLLHADPLTQATRIVLVTTDASREHVQRCHQRGADAVFVKPVRIDEFSSTVRHFMGLADGGERAPAAAAAGAGGGRLPGSAQAVARVRAHERYVSTGPPLQPPQLRCPQCDSVLQYDRSHVGGVSERHPEQWDYFACPRHGAFQYRHRTRKLRAV